MNQTAYVAFLRGINVGGNNKVSMSELKLCFAQLGFQHITTYINSGNVVFTADNTDARALETTIESALQKAFGFPIVVVVRSKKEMEGVIDALPKSWADPSDKKCNVIYLRHSIDTPAILLQLHPKSDIEELHYHAGTLFWSAFTNTLTKSNMIKLAGMPMYKDMTIRNLNTTRKVYDLMQAIV